MTNNSISTEENKITLGELLDILKVKKRFILLFTLVITFLSIVYVYTKTPIYEVKGYIELGSFKKGNQQLMVDDSMQLAKKLKILYIDILENKKIRKSLITSISVPKGANDIIEIKSQSINNSLAKDEISKVLLYVQSEHKNILDDIKQKRNTDIKNIDLKIQKILNSTVPLIEEKILLKLRTIQTFQDQVYSINKNLKKTELNNPSLAALKLIEKKDLTSFILENNTQIMDLKYAKNNYLTSSIQELEDQKTTIMREMLPHNYKNSKLLGEYIIRDNPIKPKKALIVISAFIASFILSIMSVLVMNLKQ